ncbi:MAG: copper-binding protein [Phycisphaerales bacterium]|nr:copper-binding protein [Phycisphaerales bacterium]
MKLKNRIVPTAICTSALLLSALGGCSKDDSTPPTPTAPAVSTTTDTGDADEHAGHAHGDTDAAPAKIVRSDTYADILGVITAMPVDGVPSSQLKIRHEHIPNFQKKSGEIALHPKTGVSGMRSMDMEFPPADGLSLDGFAVDNKIKFTFVINWGGERAWEVTKIEKLDASTEIDFSDKPAAMDHMDHDMDSMDHDMPMDHDAP